MKIEIDIPDSYLDFIKSEICTSKESIQEGITRLILNEIKNRKFIIDLKY